MSLLTAIILVSAAAGMIHVAVADLIPGLHKRVVLSHTAQQLALVALGSLTVWLARWRTSGCMIIEVEYVGSA